MKFRLDFPRFLVSAPKRVLVIEPTCSSAITNYNLLKTKMTDARLLVLRKIFNGLPQKMTHLVLSIKFVVQAEGSFFSTNTCYLLAFDWLIHETILSGAVHVSRYIQIDF